PIAGKAERVETGADRLLALRAAGDDGGNLLPAALSCQLAGAEHALRGDHQAHVVDLLARVEHVDAVGEQRPAGQGQKRLLDAAQAAPAAGADDDRPNAPVQPAHGPSCAPVSRTTRSAPRPVRRCSSALAGCAGTGGSGGSGCSGWRGRVKTSRPPAVGRTRVTSTSTREPIRRRPPSTTTIVPSSR